MKKLFLQTFLLLLFSLNTIAQEDWSWVNPLPQGNNLKDVFVLDENTIIAVGDRGTLLRSENGGKDWEITYRLSNIYEDIFDIQFISAEKGYLLANDPTSKIIMTEDRGINWKVIAEFDSLKLKDLFFIDENNGWAIGCSNDGGPISGIILKSVDAGYTWDTIYVEPNISEWRNPYSTIQFVDNENGWAAGKSGNSYWNNDGELLKTTNGGENWSIIYDSLNIVSGLQFLSPNIGWLIQSYQVWTLIYHELKKTMDGGLTWELILSAELTYPDYGPRGYIYFIDSYIGWAKVGYGINKTTDGGISWSLLTINSPNDGAIHFNNELNGCVVGNYGGIITTSDGGQDWIERSTVTFLDQLSSVDFYNESIGWNTANYHTFDGNDSRDGFRIRQTTDGGNFWVTQFDRWSDRGEYSLYDIQSISDQVIYAAGTGVYKTSNGGVNWNEVLQRDAQTLYFLDEETGFVGTGQDGWGVIHRTTNGGTDWDTVLAVQNHSLKSISFVNNFSGWAIVNKPYEAHSHIHRTYDAGDTWQEITVINLDLNSICFRDENVGLAVGNNGIIIRSTDGGSAWAEIWDKEGYELKSVTFSSSDNAVAVGQGNGDGIIISIDKVGGAYSIKWESWTPGLNDICFNNNIGWTVGDESTIIKTGTGSTFLEEEKINKIPTNYSLSNNFPNPFNPNTNIKYSIPHSSKVVIKVFDILGNEIEILVNEEKQTGNYEITWYAKGLPSGVYFYQLKAGNFVQTKKMILLK